MREKTGWQKEVGEGKRKPGCLVAPPHILAADPPSAWVLAPSLALLLPYLPFFLSPGAGSRRDTGPDPYPSCPASAGSAPSGPGGQAGAQTPVAHPLPRVGTGPSPPSGWGQSEHQPQSTSSPALSRSPMLSRQAGQLTTFCVGREQRGQLEGGQAPASPTA